MRFLRHPLAQFLAISVVLVGGIALTTTVLSRQAANSEALADARGTTAILARSVAEPAIPRGLVDGDAGALDRFDREVLGRLLVRDSEDLGRQVARIKIWAGDGTIVYSDKTELIGSRYDLGEEEQEIVENGGIEAEVSDLSKPENRFERDSGGLVEVYTRIWSPEGDPLLFEAYYNADDIDQRQREVFAPFQRITLGALVALLAVAGPMIWVLTRRLTVAAHERERLLLSAIEASDAERRRIARDLHDGVVQDLAGTGFSLSAAARDPGVTPEVRTGLERAGRTIRDSLRALRSLLVEIHPSDLGARGLAGALADLTAPATTAGMAVTVAVNGVDDIDDSTAALVWRVAQEAVRNAIRHSGASTLSVVVDGDPLAVSLEVIDDGSGFDPASVTDPVHYGLRGLSSLVADAGARLTVTSAPGEGTTVRLEVAEP
ncbi:MAG: sensor histidine kinase [Nocardioidaceae bacterium]